MDSYCPLTLLIRHAETCTEKGKSGLDTVEDEWTNFNTYDCDTKDWEPEPSAVLAEEGHIFL